MARYYFHIRDGGDLIPDEEGMELLDLGAAWAEAHASAADIEHAATRSAVNTGPCAVEIADATGNFIGSVIVGRQRKLA